jgi:uncharacterized membrane protein YcaP (DUF421 family)
MFDWNWITTNSTTLLMTFLSGIGAYFILILMTRIVGLRSFSKMSSFDFAITVAFGSVIASTILTDKPSLLTGGFGLIVLFGIQYVVSKSRRLTVLMQNLVDNQPLLVMAGEEILSDHLHYARLTEDDLKSQLRRSGITHPNQVLAVVFETTGDVVVLPKNEDVDPWLFSNVRGADKLLLP